MNKENLYKKIIDKYVRNETVTGLKGILDEFFESNLCIPKGENRHPYSDVLHEWVEGMPCEWLDKSQGKFVNLLQANKYHPEEYRIKPSEPVYEWQWLFPNGNNTFSASKSHFTDKESERDDNILRGLIRIEQSKRLRN